MYLSKKQKKRGDPLPLFSLVSTECNRYGGFRTFNLWHCHTMESWFLPCKTLIDCLQKKEKWWGNSVCSTKMQNVIQFRFTRYHRPQRLIAMTIGDKECTKEWYASASTFFRRDSNGVSSLCLGDEEERGWKIQLRHNAFKPIEPRGTTPRGIWLHSFFPVCESCIRRFFDRRTKKRFKKKKA